MAWARSVRGIPQTGYGGRHTQWTGLRTPHTARYDRHRYGQESGRRQTSSVCALNLWTNFMSARPDLNAVVPIRTPMRPRFCPHTNRPLPRLSADWFGQSVQVTRYISVEDPEFPTLAGLEVMGDGYAVLLGNHGPITVENACPCTRTCSDAGGSRSNLLNRGGRIAYLRC